MVPGAELGNIHFLQENQSDQQPKIWGRVASAYSFLGRILITVSVHTDREKVSTNSLIILMKALNEGLSAILL